MHGEIRKHWNTTRDYLGEFGICSFAFEWDDGTAKIYSEQRCHASLAMQEKRSKIIGFSSSLVRDINVPEEAAKDFWNFILCPKLSPWKKVFLKKSPEFLKNSKDELVGFHLPSLEGTPGQLLTSLCMISRMPIEFPECINLYWYLRRHKFSMLDSLLPTFYLELKETHVRARSGNSNHDVVPRGVTFDFIRLVRADPNLSTGLYLDGKGGGYDGNSRCFSGGHIGIDYRQPLLNILRRTDYKGFFPLHWEYTNNNYENLQLPIKEALPLLQDLRKRWYEDIKKEQA